MYTNWYHIWYYARITMRNLEYLGVLAALVGALLVALDYQVYGYFLMLVSAISLSGFYAFAGLLASAGMQIVFSIINIVGLLVRL